MRAKKRLAGLSAILLMPLLVVTASAIEPQVRPSESLPTPPVPSRGAQEPAVDLLRQTEGAEPSPSPAPTPQVAVEAGLSIEVTAFDVRGSTVFSPEELASVTAPFAGRRLDTEELIAARDAVTALYVGRGYLSSGVVIPDQDAVEGVVVLQVIEGRLAAVEVSGNRWFRTRYFVSRLRAAATTPVDADEIEQALQILQRHPRIRRINGQLVPGERLGESRLLVEVEETSPFSLNVRAANDLSPSIGAYEGGARVDFFNAFGVGDVSSIGFVGGEGLRDYSAGFSIPMTRWDTTLSFGYRYADSEIVTEDFSAIDIVSESESFTFAVEHPLWRRAGHELWIGLIAERRRSRSFVDRASFCFEVDTPRCEAVVSVLRPNFSYTHRTLADVFAVRGLLTRGLSALGATTGSEPSLPDGVFLGFLAQLSWAHRFETSIVDPILVTRLDMQFASRPLLSLEKISLGGRRTVRGYPENEAVRDQGVVYTVELRIPIPLQVLDRHGVEAIPFVDYGHGWNSRSPHRERDLASVGLGLRAAPARWLAFELFWGWALVEVPVDSPDAAQRHGVHFRVEAATW